MSRKVIQWGKVILFFEAEWASGFRPFDRFDGLRVRLWFDRLTTPRKIEGRLTRSPALRVSKGKLTTTSRVVAGLIPRGISCQKSLHTSRVWLGKDWKE